MAVQTEIRPDKLRLAEGMLIQGVEDHSLLRIVRGSFDKRLTGYPADGNRVVEKSLLSRICG
jgi:hypothetical protein